MWGIGNFDNDTAMNWIQAFSEKPKPFALDEALKKVEEAKRMHQVNIAQCETALAAAELVALLAGNPSEDFPDEVGTFLKGLPIKPPKEMLDRARRTVERIAQDSELKELWEESGDVATWLEVQGDLIERLS